MGDEMTTSHQRFLLEKAKRECYKRMDQAPSNNSSGLWCNRTWDGIMCWDDTPASTTERQSCPQYIHGFKTSSFAVKTCTEEGVWYFNSKINKTWTDYSSCVQEFSSNFQDHLDRVNSITTFGYGASLVSLSAAIIIMISCRRFHYKSNILHINLFLAFCFRSIFALMRIYLFTYGYAMSIDMEEKGGLLIFKPGSHWQCRLLFTLFHYGIAVSQSWIFIEGLYLQMLFYRTFMTQQRGIKLYIIFGWSFPLLFLIPWVISRIKYDNTLCWNINQRRGILWIIRAPLVLIIVICFLFFIDNIRILFKRTVARMRNRTSRKLAKFTVMLVPLFGVPNILFILIPADLKTAVDVPYMYISMTYSSFQGLILSFLYCFLHVEVNIILLIMLMTQLSYELQILKS
ncbi:glucagon-like peptide 1 receptor [Octopus sinensis]|uniref:Glucagon-like peptide 1 receptor n=1 Tax=Octopus sinensis TaxID=2607531 RepID=A0A7E6EUA7_9MOLL|nr:glucagon-like peptide 1 receptor [Octopus sinensis]